MIKTIPFEQSFASHEKAKYWSDKNKVKPNQVSKGSEKKYIFNCSCGHDFEQRLYCTTKGSWCPYCSGHKLCNSDECKQCYIKSFASHDKAKYWSNKNELKPRNVFLNSNVDYIFNCDKCNHDFECKLNNIIKNRWCPYCVNQKLCDKEDCKECYNKSFASHEKAKYWSNENKIEPRYVFKSSSANKYTFNCICKHNYQTLLSNDNNCPYCSSKKLCDNNDCKQCYEKSFASYDKSKYWSDKNKLKSRQVLKYSNKKFIFNCICEHEFEQSLNSTSQNSWCPYCSGHKICFNEGCKKCFEKSFSSHEKAKYWSNKNKVKPRYVFLNANTKYVFNCINNHEFNIMLCNIITGYWCPYCINKTEQKLYDNLIKNYPTLQRQFKADWCKKKTYLPFDFVIPEHQIIIELDGRQHFEQVNNWVSPEEQYQNDKYKMDSANKNNYSVIRIIQNDVFNDTYDWFNKLIQSIEQIIQDNKIQNIFICKNNEYKKFKI